MMIIIVIVVVVVVIIIIIIIIIIITCVRWVSKMAGCGLDDRRWIPSRGRNLFIYLFIYIFFTTESKTVWGPWSFLPNNYGTLFPEGEVTRSWNWTLND